MVGGGNLSEYLRVAFRVSFFIQGIHALVQSILCKHLVPVLKNCCYKYYYAGCTYWTHSV